MSKIFNKAKNYLSAYGFMFIIHVYQLLFAFTLIGTLFYLRFLPRISQELWVAMNDYQIFSTIVKIGFILVNIYVILVLMDILKPKNTSSFKESVKLKLVTFANYIENILINFYEFLWYSTEKFIFILTKKDLFHYHVIRHISIFFLVPKRQKILAVFLLSLSLVPRIIFVTAFCYDVFIQQYLHYTFVLLPFLLLPLLERFVLFIFRHFFSLYWKETSQYLKISQEKTATEIVTIHEFLPEYAENIPYKYKSFRDYFDNHLMVLVKVDMALDTYKQWKYEQIPFLKTLLVLNIIRLILLLLLLLYGIS